MAQRGRPSINKRQKELARQEKRREKEERRVKRKEDRGPRTPGEGPPIAEAEEGDDPVESRSPDPIRAYLRQISVADLLTREREVEVARRIETGERKLRGAWLASPLAVPGSATRLRP